MALRGCKVFPDKIAIYECTITFTDPFQVVGIGPLHQVCYQSVFDRIGVDVATQMQ